jgi:hypothetical protein
MTAQGQPMGLPADDLAKLYAQTQPIAVTEGITRKQLARILNDAADEAGRLADFYVGSGTAPASLTAARYKSMQAGLGGISAQMWAQTGRITQAGMYAQAQLAADQALDLDMFSGFPAKAIQEMTQALHFEAAQAVDDIISHRTNGHKLSDRIYANAKVSHKQVGAIVDRHLALQSSAKSLARDVRKFYKPSVPGGSSYASMRLARTEINNAHHDTSIRLAADKPWVLGFKWNLSGSHPKPDQCNDYADRDDGQGKGVFSKGDVPGKPHPQCLCYLTHLMEDDEAVQQKIMDGSYDDYLNSRGVFC